MKSASLSVDPVELEELSRIVFEALPSDLIGVTRHLRHHSRGLKHPPNLLGLLALMDEALDHLESGSYKAPGTNRNRTFSIM